MNELTVISVNTRALVGVSSLRIYSDVVSKVDAFRGSVP